MSKAIFTSVPVKSHSFLPETGQTYLNLLPDHFMGVLSLVLVSSFPVCVLLSHSFPHLCHIVLVCVLLQLQPLVLPHRAVAPTWVPHGFTSWTGQICKCHSGQAHDMDVMQHNLFFCFVILFLTIPTMFISELWEYEVLVQSSARADATNATNLELHCLEIGGPVLSSALSLIPWGPSAALHRQV